MSRIRQPERGVAVLPLSLQMTEAHHSPLADRAFVDLRWFYRGPFGIGQTTEVLHLLHHLHVAFDADGDPRPPLVELSDPGTVHKSAINQQVANRSFSQHLFSSGHHLLAHLGLVNRLRSKGPQQGPYHAVLPHAQHTDLQRVSISMCTTRNVDVDAVHHPQPTQELPRAIRRQAGQYSLLILQKIKGGLQGCSSQLSSWEPGANTRKPWLSTWSRVGGTNPVPTSPKVKTCAVASPA